MVFKNLLVCKCLEEAQLGAINIGQRRWREREGGRIHLHRNAVLLDDISNAVPISGNWPKAK
jgi:hypothetical protein